MIWGDTDSAIAMADLVDPSVFQSKPARSLFLIMAREAAAGFSYSALRPIVEADAPHALKLYNELKDFSGRLLDESSHEALAQSVAQWGQTERLKRATANASGSLQSGVPYSEVRNTLDKQLSAIDLSALSDQPYDDKQDMARRVHEFLKGDTMGGLRFGYVRLDKRVTPMLPGNLTVFAGRPSSGKSTAMRNVARNAIVIYKEPTAYFSLEMIGEEKLPHFPCMDTGLAYVDYVERTFTSWDRKRFDASLEEWVKNPLFKLNERAEASPEWLLRTMKRYRAEGTTTFIIDHLHRVSYGVKAAEIRLAVADFAQRLKNFAVTNRCRVIVGAQLLKGSVHEEPTEEMIRETGNIIDESDKIFMVWLPLVAGWQSPDGTFTPNVSPSGARTLAGEAEKGATLGEDSERVYLKVTKQRVRKLKGYIAIPFNPKSGLMYEDTSHNEERVA